MPTQNIGLIKSETEQGYELEAGLISTLEGLQIELGIPASLNVQNTQEIESYLLSE